jgi:hypothetical protein
MPAEDYFQIQNYQSIVTDTEKQLHAQRAELESFRKQWEVLAMDLVLDIGIDIDQITPEFENTLGHMQKAINVQDSYRAKLHADLVKVTEVGKAIEQSGNPEEGHDEMLKSKKQELTNFFSNRGNIEQQRNVSVQDLAGNFSFMGKYKSAKKFCDKAFGKSGENAEEGDDDMQVESNVQAIQNKCPLTQKEFVTPVCVPEKCKKCVFEKLAICDYVQSKGGNADHRNVRCPTPGCATVITKDSDIETSQIFSIMLLKYLKN